MYLSVVLDQPSHGASAANPLVFLHVKGPRAGGADGTKAAVVGIGSRARRPDGPCAAVRVASSAPYSVLACLCNPASQSQVSRALFGYRDLIFWIKESYMHDTLNKIYL